eukprot:3263845-Lingulodinium_polyedra.AAC.1
MPQQLLHVHLPVCELDLVVARCHARGGEAILELRILRAVELEVAFGELLAHVPQQGLRMLGIGAQGRGPLGQQQEGAGPANGPHRQGPLGRDVRSRQPGLPLCPLPRAVGVAHEDLEGQLERLGPRAPLAPATLNPPRCVVVRDARHLEGILPLDSMIKMMTI